MLVSIREEKKAKKMLKSLDKFTRNFEKEFQVNRYFDDNESEPLQILSEEFFSIANLMGCCCRQLQHFLDVSGERRKLERQQRSKPVPRMPSRKA